MPYRQSIKSRQLYQLPPHHYIKEHGEHYYGQGDSNEEEEPFWQLDEAIGEGWFFGENEKTTIRLKVHISSERYHRAGELDEILSLQAKSGTRIYVMANPYILEPDYTLSVGLYPQPAQEGTIGEVTGFADLVAPSYRSGYGVTQPDFQNSDIYSDRQNTYIRR